MAINCVVFLVVSIRTKKVVNDRAYQGKRNSRSCIGCVGWVKDFIFYSIFLTFISCLHFSDMQFQCKSDLFVLITFNLFNDCKARPK